MSKYNPDQIAQLAAIILQGHETHRPMEPHHVRNAVQASTMIVDVTAAALAQIEAEATAEQA